MIRTCIVDLGTNKVVNVVEYEESVTGKPPGMDETHLAIPSDKGQIGWAYASGQIQAPVITLTPEEIRSTYETAAQALLDSTARSWGYDSIISAASYGLSTIAQYKADAIALIGWRDSLWQAAYAIEVSVQGGAPMPATAADFLAELPAPPTRPTA